MEKKEKSWGIQQAYKLKKIEANLVENNKKEFFLPKNRKAERIFHVDYGGILSVLNFLLQHLGLIRKRENL